MKNLFIKSLTENQFSNVIYSYENEEDHSKSMMVYINTLTNRAYIVDGKNHIVRPATQENISKGAKAIVKLILPSLEQYYKDKAAEGLTKELLRITEKALTE